MFSQPCQQRRLHGRSIPGYAARLLVVISFLFVTAGPAAAGPDTKSDALAGFNLHPGSNQACQSGSGDGCVPTSGASQKLKPADVPPDGAFAPGQVLVQWADGAEAHAASTLLDTHGWQLLHAIEGIDAAVVRVPTGDELAAVDALRADPLVKSAEPDYLAYALEGTVQPVLSAEGFQPNDSYWADQWWTRRMQAPMAWELTTGASNVVVAVVDSGIDLSHPEFAGRLEPGYDYVDLDGVPQDAYGHGTHVAGIIAARGNNAMGVAGLSWSTRLMPLRVLDGNGVGRVSDVASAISRAINNGSSVINLSLALTAPSTTLNNAVLFAYNTGALVIGATGNDSLPGQPLAPVRYPAAYAEVLAVASTTHWDGWADYSNGGPEVNVAAPGGESSDLILSASLGGGYAYLYGTSMAAAQVTGIVALLRAYAPQLSNNAIKDVLRSTADKVGAYAYVNGRNDRLGYGRVNTNAALRWTMQPGLTVTPVDPALLVQAGGAGTATNVVLSNDSAQALRWTIVNTSPSWLTVTPSSGLDLTYQHTATLHIGMSSVPPVGQYNASIQIRTTDPAGQQGNIILTVRVVVASQVHQTFLPVVGSGQLAPQWIDTSIGLGLSLGDDGTQAVPLPFQFPFYGRNYGQVWINANGFLSFGTGYTGSEYAQNHCLPSISSPNGAIFALWDDLDPSQGGQVRYALLGASQFVAEWRDVPTKSNGQPNSFQVVLWPDGQVRITYAAVGDPSGSTVGLESWDASIDLPVACNGTGHTPQPGQTRFFSTALP